MIDLSKEREARGKNEPRGVFISDDIVCRISRLHCAVDFVARASIALEGEMKASISDAGYTLELICEEGLRLNNEIDAARDAK